MRLERKYLGLVSNPEILIKKSRSRLELRDLEDKILVLVSNLEIERVEVVVEETALVEEQGGLEEEELGRYYDDLEDEFEQEEKEWCDFC